ncbi:MAG: hypothetical protein ABI702_04565, partial [Burkholderiales bacterium]
DFHGTHAATSEGLQVRRMPGFALAIQANRLPDRGSGMPIANLLRVVEGGVVRHRRAISSDARRYKHPG